MAAAARPSMALQGAKAAAGKVGFRIGVIADVQVRLRVKASSCS